MAVAVERVAEVASAPILSVPVTEGSFPPKQSAAHDINMDFGFRYRKWMRQTHPVLPEDRVRPVARLHSDLKQKVGIGFDTVHEWEQATDELTMRDFMKSLPPDYFNK